MKVLLYENFITKGLGKSGVGMAIRHQKQALDLEKIKYTNNLKDSFDIAHFNYYDPFAYFAIKKLKQKGIPIIIHAHSTEEDFRNSFVLSNQLAPLFKKWLIKFYSQADLLLTPTPYAKRLIEAYGIKVPVIPISNGINLERFKRVSSLKDYFNSLHGINDQAKVIINIGFPIERKGVLDFIEISKALPEYQFYWIGETPKALQKHSITKAIKKAPLNCHFLGYTTGKPLMAAFNRADLFFFSSNEETEGIVVLEALAMQIPLLIRNIPVYDEWLEDGKTVYKGNTNAEFIDLITAICNHELPNLTKLGLKVAAARDIKLVAKELSRIYQSLLNK